MANSDNSLGSVLTMTEESPTITGNKCFILEPEMTFKSKEHIKRQILQLMPDVQEVSRDECDFIVVLCFIVSRVGTDIDCAVNALDGISESKPAVFMVLHHTFDSEKFVSDSSSFIKRSKTLTVDCLFHEDEGLLNCVKNNEALSRIHQFLQVTQTDTQSDSFLIYESCSSLVGNWIQWLWTWFPFTSAQGENCSKSEELVVVLLGMSRSETTAVGHRILGREETQADISPDSQTQITVDVGEVHGQRVTVINTPDCFSSDLSTEEIKRHLQLCIRLSSGGPYVFLLVILKEQITDEEKEKMEMILEEIREKNIVILCAVTDKQQNQRFQTLMEKSKICVLNISQAGNKVENLDLWNFLQSVGGK